MRRLLRTSSLAFWCAGLPGLAWADQGVAIGAAPIEIGATLGTSADSPTFGPVVAVNFGPRDALEFSAAFSAKKRQQGSDDLYTVNYRRTVYRANRGAIAVTAGGSFLKSEWHTQSRIGGVLYQSDWRASSRAVTFGVGGSWDFTRRLTFRAGYQIHLGPETTNRLSAALVVPVGARPATAGTRTMRVQAAEMSRADPMVRLRAGQTVWVTTADGREIRADVVSVSADSLELAQNRSTVQLDRSAIHRIETADGIADGLLRGLLIGVGAGAGLTLLACSGGCYEYTGLYTMISMLAGAGTGALVGTLGDSVIEHRRVVYGASSTIRLRVAPALSPTSAGVRATLQW